MGDPKRTGADNIVAQTGFVNYFISVQIHQCANELIFNKCIYIVFSYKVPNHIPIFQL